MTERRHDGDRDTDRPGPTLVQTHTELRALTDDNTADDAVIVKNPADGRQFIVITAEHIVDLREMR